MKLLKFLIVLALAVAIFGTAGFFAYQLYLKPAAEEKQEEKKLAEAPPPTPPPDYSLPAFEKAIAVTKSGTPVEAREALLQFVAQFPQSSKVADAKEAVGEINTRFVFTTMPAPDKVDYTVVAGDSLLRVAGKTKSNAELILRSNNLATIDLQIGQALRIPQLDIAMVLSREARTLTLFNRGQFFKEYPLLAVELPGAASQGEVATEVRDKVALKGGERVAFGGRDYVGSERWIMLGVANAVIRGRPEPGADGQPAPMPPGIVLSQEDIEEIFPLVSRGTKVTIQ